MISNLLDNMLWVTFVSFIWTYSGVRFYLNSKFRHVSEVEVKGFIFKILFWAIFIVLPFVCVGRAYAINKRRGFDPSVICYIIWALSVPIAAHSYIGNRMREIAVGIKYIYKYTRICLEQRKRRAGKK